MKNDTLLYPVPDTDVIEFEESPPPTDNELTSVAALVTEQRALEDDISALTAALDEKLKAYKDVSERRLPEALAAVGMKSFVMADGGKVEAQSRFFGAKLTDPAGLAWLEGNGGADLIKTAIHVELPRENLDVAREIVGLLRAHRSANVYTKLELEQSVNPQSLASFVKELVEASKDPPLEDLGVYKRTKARIGGRKLRTVKFESAFVVEGEPAAARPARSKTK